MGEPNLSTARIDLYKSREDPDNYGALLSGASLRLLNLATEGIKGKRDIKTSDESTSDLLPGEQKMVGGHSDGPIQMDLRIGPQLDEFLEEAMCSTLSADLGISSNAITFAASDNSISGAPLSAVVAQTWIRLGGTGGVSGNRGDAYVLSKPSSTKCILAYHTLADEAPSATVTIKGRYVRNGTTLLASTYERKKNDASTTPHQAIPGCYVNDITVTITAREIVKVVVNVMGLFPLDESASSICANAITPADVGESLDASNNLTAFRQNGVLNGNIRMFEFKLTNNLAEIPIGSQTNPDGFAPAVKGLTGNFEGFSRDAEVRRSLIYGFQAMEIHFAKRAANGDTYYFTFWKIKSSDDGSTPKDARTGPAILKAPWTAERGPNGYWMQVCKIT